MLKKSYLLFLSLALGIGVGSVGAFAPAHADTMYDWTFTGTLFYGTGPASMTAGGALTTNVASVINFINGTNNGVTLANPAILAPGTCCGVTPSNDNQLSYPTAPFLSLAGLGFVDSANEDVNIFFDGTSYDDVIYAAGDPSVLDATIFVGSFSVTPTPLPASLPLLGSALGTGFFIARWRSRRKFKSATTPG